MALVQETVFLNRLCILEFAGMYFLVTVGETLIDSIVVVAVVEALLIHIAVVEGCIAAGHSYIPYFVVEAGHNRNILVVVVVVAVADNRVVLHIVVAVVVGHI